MSIRLESGSTYIATKNDGSTLIFKVLGNLHESDTNDDRIFVEVEGKTLPLEEAVGHYISIRPFN